MCGIAGIISLNEPNVDQEILKKMSARIRSRGPDDEGFYFNHHVGLAHQRLSIIDLKTGHQPMTTTDGRYTIVFNGEIYNFREIRERLEKGGECFKTHSDTEVLLELYALKGRDCLSELNGMFAFAVWDAIKKELFLARDRMGKKPLYYCQTPQHFVFASELKALLEWQGLRKEIAPQALSLYLTYESVPAPYAIIKGVNKLRQAHWLTFREGLLRTQRYWNIPLAQKCGDDEKTAAKKLVELIDQAVQYRLISDVPLGVFLSGGIDSSSVVAFMARHREGKDIKTFSIHFEEASYDESFYCNEVAKKFGTDHHHETLTADKMLDILPEVTSYLDEPFADGSILPTYLLSRFTRQHVTVALGGDGADELFAGYPTFVAGRLAPLYQKFPGVIKKAVRGAARFLPTSDKNMSFDFMVRQFLNGADYEGALKNQAWLAAFPPHEQSFVFHPQFYEHIRSFNPLDLITQELRETSPLERQDQPLYFYQKFYLCDDILFKTDRASMAHSLEVRAPYLDMNVVEYASSLPYSYKLKGVTTKYILKKALNGILPPMITQRKKKGFGIPIASWLKGRLRPLLTDTLNKNRIESDGIFHWPTVHKLIKEHLSGKGNHRKRLFALLMFHLWMEEYL